MTEKLICEECGVELPANAPQGLCPRCLAATGLNLALGQPDGAGPRTAGSSLPMPRSAPDPNPFHEHPPHSALGNVRCFGDYELLEEVARGGMGVVYRARQVSLDRVVAVKMLLFGEFSSDEFVRRFRMEAKAAASLQHPNIVAIHEVGEHQGQPFFSMDYVDGKSLAEMIRSQPFPARQAAGYVSTIAEAIHYAHQHGVLHRDLKPSNVLIDANGQPHITDFGLAKQLQANPNLTATGQVIGSPNYMPPEQAGAHPNGAGPASDVYSMGALLYHLLTGRPPFVAETIEQILLLVARTEPVSPRLLNPSIPRDLDTICLKCLEKDPRRRYGTGQGLADDLSRFLRGEPISARPLNWAQKVWRWCQREPALAAWITTAALFLLIGSSLVVWQWRRAETNAELRRHFLYAWNMKAAFSDWKDLDLAPVLAALRKQIPKPGELDFRGFEWRHLWWQWRQHCALLLPERKQVAGDLAFSPDGKMLAAYYWDDTLRWWRVDSSRRDLFVLTNAASLGGFIGNGDRYLTGTCDGSVQVRSTGNGAVVRSIPAAGQLVAVSSKAERFATIDSGGLLKVFDLASGAAQFTMAGKVARRPNSGWTSLVALAPDGKTLAVVKPGNNTHGRDDAVELFSLGTSEVLPTVRANSQICCLAFSPDSSRLTIGAGNGTITLLQLDTRATRLLPGHGLPIRSLAFSGDGRTLAAGGGDERIQLWDLTSSEPLPRIFREPIGEVWSIVFSADNKRLAAGSRNTVLRVWNLAEEPVPDRSEDVAAHEDWGNFTFSPDSKLMAAACKGNVVKVWEVASFKVIASRAGASYVVAFSQSGKDLLICASDATPLWWNWETGATRAVPGQNTAGAIAADLSPNRKLGALGYRDGSIQLIEIDSGREIRFWRAHTDEARSLKFSPRGDKLVSGSRDRSVTVWDVATQRKLGSNEPGEHRGAVCAVVFSHDGKKLASGCGSDMIKLWSESDLSRALASMPYHKAAIRTLDFSPDGRTLASGSDDATVRLFNVALNQELAAVATEGTVRLVVFSPDGNTLAIVTEYGVLRLLRASTLEDADREARILLR